MGWKRWVVLGVVVAGIGVVAGPFVYFRMRSEAPAPLGLTQTEQPAASGDVPSSGGLDGTWKVAGGSQVGYRVKEVAFGQSGTAVGRTTSVTGSIVVSGTAVRTATFTADMRSVTSDQNRRDNQFNGRIMDTATHPTATFTLAEPIEVGSVPNAGHERSVTAKGRLTLRGTTKDVDVKITGRRSGGLIEVSGSIPIVFAHWNIPNPSFGPISAEDNGLLEFSLKLSRA